MKGGRKKKGKGSFGIIMAGVLLSVITIVIVIVLISDQSRKGRSGPVTVKETDVVSSLSSADDKGKTDQGTMQTAESETEAESGSETDESDPEEDGSPEETDDADISPDDAAGSASAKAEIIEDQGEIEIFIPDGMDSEGF